MVRARTSGPALTSLEATRLINSKNAQVVDVRAANDFATGSLPNAKNIPAANLKDRVGELKHGHEADRLHEGSSGDGRDDHGTEQDDAMNGVGRLHQRRVQNGGHTRDDLNPDEDGEDALQ